MLTGNTLKKDIKDYRNNYIERNIFVKFTVRNNSQREILTVTIDFHFEIEISYFTTIQMFEYGLPYATKYTQKTFSISLCQQEEQSSTPGLSLF